MNSLVVHYSQFGNTRRVAETIHKEFCRAGTAHTVSAGQLVPEDLQGIDLLVMGAPTHKMNLPEALRQVFESLPRRSLRGAHVAAFDTSYEMSAFLARFTAAKRLARELRRLGSKQLVRPETFHVIRNREGPLCDGEVERARAWAGVILAAYERIPA